MMHGHHARFLRDLAVLWPQACTAGRPDEQPDKRQESVPRLGLAVSGGPDSMALLALAHGALPGRVAAATVDHGLRAQSGAEAEMVSAICAEIGVPHHTLKVCVPAGNVQGGARKMRYQALDQWAQEQGLSAIATAHHADDQAETLIMRLNRASGLAGLAAIRAHGRVPGGTVLLLRPLLGWRREELAAVIRDTGWPIADDPSNHDPRFDRVRIRAALQACTWLDVPALAHSVANLADAAAALEWAVEQEWQNHVVRHGDGAICYQPHAPRAIAIGVLKRAIGALGGTPRGGGVARLHDVLAGGGCGNLAGVMVRASSDGWILQAEPERKH